MLNVEFLPNGLKGASLIQHSTFNIQHYSFNIQHSTLFIQHSTFNTIHSTFNIQHSTLPFKQVLQSIHHHVHIALWVWSSGLLLAVATT